MLFSRRIRLVVQLLFLLLAGRGERGLAQSNLSPANSSELQRLLRVQNQQPAVNYKNFSPLLVPTCTYQRLFLWNQIALDTTAIDHTPTQPSETRIFGEQFGPARASRAMAIIHIAMFEVVNATTHKYASYAGVSPVRGEVSVDYAIAQAAHDALLALYPSQADRLHALFASDVSHIQASPASLARGQRLGRRAAYAIQTLRAKDGAQVPDPSAGSGDFTPIGGVGHWTPDPVSQLKLYLGAFWGNVRPFTLASSSQFRAPPPPALTDALYTQAFQQVQALGGDPAHGTPTLRTVDQTLDGIFWSYDGTPELCAPPRLYNEIARTLALEQGMSDVTDAARMLALINTAMADAAIAAWETKWHYQFWRPVTALRSADQGGNFAVTADPAWYPLGGQATNTHGPNFTPPFPAYVSGHAAIGGALFQILRHFYPDATPFTFISDEENGVNKDINGNVRPFNPRHFTSLTDAEERNAESRILLGVHWQFDADAGTTEGHQVADWVWDHAFRPVN